MSTAVQRRRGTNTEHDSFTGLEGEISVNTTNESVHVHDGSTAGGFEMARADMDNVANIDDTIIGATTPAAGTFTTVTASSDLVAESLEASRNGTVKVTLTDTSPTETYAEITNANGVLKISGDVGNAVAGSSVQILLDGAELARYTGSDYIVGGTSAGAASAVTLYADGSVNAAAGTFTSLANTGDTTLGANNTSTVNIVKASDTATVVLSGGNANNSGSNLLLRGGSHASSANDWALRHGTTNILGYDASANAVTVPVDDFIVGGTTSGAASAVTLYATGTIEGNTSSANSQTLLSLGNSTGVRATLNTDGGGDAYMYLYDETDTLRTAFRTDTNVSYLNGGGNFVVGGTTAGAASAVTLYADGKAYPAGGIYLGGTAAANLLDDYEEGAWTPSLSGATSGTLAYSSISGNNYTKVGRLILCTTYATFDTTGHSLVGQIRISGLPVATTTGNNQLVSISYCNMFNFDEAQISVNGRVLTTSLLLHRGSATTGITDADVTASTSRAMMLGVSYHTV